MGVDVAQERAAMAERKKKEEKKREKETFERETAEINRQFSMGKNYQSRPAAPGIPVLDCAACKTEKSMFATQVPRFGEFIRLIGYIIALPSVLGVLLSSFAIVAGMSNGSGESFGGALGIFGALFLAAISLVSGLVGYLLLTKKKVFRCETCGYIIDRA